MHEAKVSLDKGRHGAVQKPNRKGKDKIEEASAASVRKTQSEVPQNTTAEKLIFYPKVEAAIESASNYKHSVSKKPPMASKRRPQASHSHPVTHYQKHAYAPPDFGGAVIEKFVVINGKQIPIFRKNLKPMKNVRTRAPYEEDKTRLKVKKPPNKKKVYATKYPDVPTHHSHPEVFVTSPPKVKYLTDTVGKYSHAYIRPTTKYKSYHSDSPSLSSAYHFTNPSPYRYVNKVEVVKGKPKPPTRQRQRLNQTPPPPPPESEESQSEKPNTSQLDDFDDSFKFKDPPSAEFDSNFKIRDRPALNINPPTTEISIFGEPDNSPWVPIAPPPEYHSNLPNGNKGTRKPSNGLHYKGPNPTSHYDDDGPIVNDKFIGFPDFPNEFPDPDMKPPKAKLPQKHLKRPKQNSWLMPAHEIADSYRRPHNRPNPNYNSDSNQYVSHEDHFNPNYHSPMVIKTVVRPHESEPYRSAESGEGSPEVVKHRGRRPETYVIPRHPGHQPSSKFRNTKNGNTPTTKYSYFNRQSDPKEPYEPSISSHKKPKHPDSFKFEHPDFKVPSYPETFKFESDFSTGTVSPPFSPYDDQPIYGKPYRKQPGRTRTKANTGQKGQRTKTQSKPQTAFDDEAILSEFPGSFESSKFNKNMKNEHFGDEMKPGSGADHFHFENDNHQPYRPTQNSNFDYNFPDYSQQFNVHSSYSFEPTYSQNIALTTQAHMEVAPTYPSNFNPVPPPTAPLDSSNFFSENHERVKTKPVKESSGNNYKYSQNLVQSSTNVLNVTEPPFASSNSTNTVPIETTSEQAHSTTTAKPNEKPNRYRWRPRKQPTQHHQLGDWSAKSNSSRAEIFRRRNRPKPESSQNQMTFNTRPNSDRDSVSKPSNNYYQSVLTPPRIGSNERFPHVQLHYTVPDFSAMTDKARPQSESKTRPSNSGSTDQTAHATSAFPTKENRPYKSEQTTPQSQDVTSSGVETNTTDASQEVLLSTSTQNPKPYQTVSRQNYTNQEEDQNPVKPSDSAHPPTNSRHPYLPKDMDTNLHGQQVVYKDGEQKNHSNVLVTYYGSFDVPEKVMKNDKPNELSELPKKPEEIAPIKYIENLTLQHYSMPENSLPYQPMSNTQQNRIINIANELNKDPPASEKNTTNRRQDVNKTFLESYVAYPYSAVDGRNERAFNFSVNKSNATEVAGNKTEATKNLDRLPLTVHINKRKTESDRVLSYSDLLDQLEKQKSTPNPSEKKSVTEPTVTHTERKKRIRRSLTDQDKAEQKRMILEVASSGTTAFIPVDTKKFPFYTALSEDRSSQFSPLRYAQNPKQIPKKSGRGMEFYESRGHIDCDDVEGPDDVVPTRSADGEWNEQPQPEKPRLPQLGDRIKCFRRKFFDEDPLDNPFFKEEFIGPPDKIRVAKVIYDDEDEGKSDDAHAIVDEELRGDEDEEDEEEDFENEETRHPLVFVSPTVEKDKNTETNGENRRALGNDFRLYKDIISNIKNMHTDSFDDSGVKENTGNGSSSNGTVSSYGDNDTYAGANGSFSVFPQPETSGQGISQVISIPDDYLKNHKWQNPNKATRDTRKNQTLLGLQFADSASSQNNPRPKHTYFHSGLQSIFRNKTKVRDNFVKSNIHDEIMKDAYIKGMRYPVGVFKKPTYGYSHILKYQKPGIYKNHKFLPAGSKLLIKKRPVSPVISNSVYDDSSEDEESETWIGKEKEKLKTHGAPSKQIIHMYQQAPVFDFLSPLDNLLAEPAGYPDAPIKIVHNFYNLHVSPKSKRPASLTDHDEAEPEYSNYNYNYNYYDENAPGNEDPEHPEYANSPEYAQLPTGGSDYEHTRRSSYEDPRVTLYSYPRLGQSYAPFSLLPPNLLDSMKNRHTRKIVRQKRDLKPTGFESPQPFSISRTGKSVPNKNSNATDVNNLFYRFMEAMDVTLNDTVQNTSRSKKHLYKGSKGPLKASNSAETFMKTDETMFYPKLMFVREVKIDTTRRPKPLPGFVSRHNPVFSSRYNKEVTEFQNGTWTLKKNATTTTETPVTTITPKPKFKFRFPPRTVKPETVTSTTKPVASESNSNFSVVSPVRGFRKPEDVFRRPKHVDVYESLRRLKGETRPDPGRKKSKSKSRGSQVFSDAFKHAQSVIDNRVKHDNKESPSFTETSHLTDFVTTINPMKDSLIYVVSPHGQGQWMKEVKVELDDLPWHPVDPYESTRADQKRVPGNNALAGSGIAANYDDPFGFHYGLRTSQHRKTPSRSRGPPDQGPSPTSQTFEVVKLVDGAMVEEKVNLDVFSADLNS